MITYRFLTHLDLDNMNEEELFARAFFQTSEIRRMPGRDSRQRPYLPRMTAQRLITIRNEVIHGDVNNLKGAVAYPMTGAWSETVNNSKDEVFDQFGSLLSSSQVRIDRQYHLYREEITKQVTKAITQLYTNLALAVNESPGMHQSHARHSFISKFEAFQSAQEHFFARNHICAALSGYSSIDITQDGEKGNAILEMKSP